MKTMILSILHDNTLMRQENFATGLDIFTGDVDEHCPQNKCYGEIHTGEAWQPAKERFCGRDGKYMPFGIIIFGDKSHTDLVNIRNIFRPCIKVKYTSCSSLWTNTEALTHDALVPIPKYRLGMPP